MHRSLILVYVLTSGCATVYPECEKYTESGQKQECINAAREYDRVEHIEEFKIKVRNCELSGGYLQYNGPYNSRIKRILDKKDWDRLRKLETIHFGCAPR